MDEIAAAIRTLTQKPASMIALIRDKKSATGKLVIGLGMGLPILFGLLWLDTYYVSVSALSIKLSTIAIVLILFHFGKNAIKEAAQMGEEKNGVWGRRGFTIKGIVLIGVPFSTFAYISETYGLWCILLAGFLAYLHDGGGFGWGYLAKAKGLDTHPIYPKVSKKKSWEGFFSGVLISNLFCDTLVYYFFPETFIKYWPAFAIGNLLGCIAGTFGDLYESKLKRDIDWEDSGTALASHGGYLDRVDSLVAVMWFFIFWLFYGSAPVAKFVSHMLSSVS